MNNNFDMDDVRFFLECIVANFDILTERFSDEVTSIEALQKKSGSNGCGNAFVNRASIIYAPAFNGIYISLYALLEKIGEGEVQR